jgi:hypothetical protein
MYVIHVLVEAEKVIVIGRGLALFLPIVTGVVTIGTIRG